MLRMSHTHAMSHKGFMIHIHTYTHMLSFYRWESRGFDELSRSTHLHTHHKRQLTQLWKPWDSQAALDSFHGDGIHEWHSQKLSSTHLFILGTEARVSRCPWDFASCMFISGKSESRQGQALCNCPCVPSLSYSPGS